MNNTIIKPISVVRQEFIEKLIDDVNNCQLPMFVVEPILEDLLKMVRTAAQEQYKTDKAQYEEQLKKQNETNLDKN